jgi:cytoskeletal protein CcmA (bactofilin family)
MWWEKKNRPSPAQEPRQVSSLSAPDKLEDQPSEPTPRGHEMPSVSQNQTILGQSIVLHGEMSGKEDLLIEGQLEGTINLPEHSVTVGSHGEVKAEVHARQVIVLGTLTGNITATDKVEIRKTGQVVGDLVAAAVAIEDGAYFKGSIDILREQSHRGTGPTPVSDPLKASV